MKQIAMKKQMWNAAGIAGLALGAVSSASLFAEQFIAGSLEPATAWQMVVSTLLWIVKFGGCIWLMNFFMKKYATENNISDTKQIFRMGRTTAFLSALMFSAIYLANMLYISADFYEQVFGTAIQQMSATLDSNSLAALEKVVDNIPQIAFFYNLLYCFIYGTVLSAILARNIGTKDPFTENTPDEQ